MSDPTDGLAKDGFEDFYFQKLKSWLPEVYWNNDLGDGSLEQFLRAVADRVAEMRREIDRIWSASSIELADDWAVDFIGDLVGAEPLSAQNARGNRTVAANMMEYHRRKTTRYLLEKLIGDIVDTEGYVREIERWLARPPHSLEMAYLRRAPLSKGIVGGLPNFTAQRADDAALIAFDEFARLPDFSPRRGREASFDYATIHFNLFVNKSYRLDMATPFWLDSTHATLDPSGRAVPLFHSATFDHRLGLWPTGPEEFPVRMRCARFNDAEFRIIEQGLSTIGDPGITARLTDWIGVSFPSLQEFRRIVKDQLTVAQFNLFFDDLLRESMQAECAKARQLRDDVLLDVGPFADLPKPTREAHEIVAANLSRWFTAANWPDRAALLVDVDLGAVQFKSTPNRSFAPPEMFHPRFHHIGLVHEVGAGTFPRDTDVDLGPPYNDANQEVALTPTSSGLVPIRDNRRYVWQWDPGTRRHDVVGELRLVAADRVRPYVVSVSDAGTLDFTIFGTDGQDNHLVIDGLWLGVLANVALETAVASADNPAPVTHARLIVDGRFETVTLRHVSIDPGGEQVRLDPLVARSIPAITTEIEGSVRNLLIEDSIIGPLFETRVDASLLNAGQIRIRNSVVLSIDPSRAAISIELGRLYLENTTVFGACNANLLFATNTLFDGPIYVTNRQQSCLRFSALGRYEGVAGVNASAVPRQFECISYEETIPGSTFRSTRFGEPDFAALSDLADRGILRGGEHRTEIGVGNNRLWTQRREDLARVVAKFLPVEQNAQIYEETGGLT